MSGFRRQQTAGCGFSTRHSGTMDPPRRDNGSLLSEWPTSAFFQQAAKVKSPRGRPADLLINHRGPYKRCDDTPIKRQKSTKTYLKLSVLAGKSKVKGQESNDALPHSKGGHTEGRLTAFNARR